MANDSFTIHQDTLPASRAKADFHAVRAGDSRTGRSVFLPRKERPCILVVDDDLFLFDLMEDAFGPDYDVECVTNGHTALHTATGRMPDLILLDVLMPQMDGFQVCRRLKEQPWTRAIPILLISSMNDASSMAQGMDAGAADYLAKPIDPSAVRARAIDLMKARTA